VYFKGTIARTSGANHEDHQNRDVGSSSHGNSSHWHRQRANRLTPIPPSTNLARMNSFTMLVVPSSPAGRSGTSNRAATRSPATRLPAGSGKQRPPSKPFEATSHRSSPTSTPAPTTARTTKCSGKPSPQRDERSHHRPRHQIQRKDLLRRHRPNTRKGRLQKRSPRSPHLGKIGPPPHWLSLL